MKEKMIKIPILSAAAFITLISGGCAQRAADTDTTVLSETYTELTKDGSETSASAKSKTKAKAKSKNTTTASSGKTKKTSSKKAGKTAAKSETSAMTETVTESTRYTGLISSPEEFEIYDVNGNGTEYEFKYDGQFFEAEYTAEPENWKIIDSYKITDRSDMEIICKALSDFHPIHGSDYTSYRTPEDMAYEWEQHNLAYQLLPSGNSWRENAKDVDLDPEDQGKNIYELYKARTGGDLF